jgi:transcriptional regulator with XRE-family HTH domain
MNLADIGIAVRAARKKLKVSQVELARKCGLSRATISALESGKIQELGFGRINAVGKCVGLELAWVPTLQPQKVIRTHTLLAQLRKRYIWWEIPGSEPTEERIIAQVMELGSYEDTQSLEEKIGLPKMKQVLANAKPGWFSSKSWNYWHLRLGVSESNHVPPMPRRNYDLQTQL